MFLLLAMAAVTVFAADTTDLLQPFPAQVLRHEVVAFRPVKAHHFSLEAPQKCGSGQLVERSAAQIKCQFTGAGDAEAVLNVCDDKKTFCKPVSLKVKVAERGANAKSEKLVKNQDLNKELKHRLVPGFETGAPAEIQKRAAEKGKPVFLMISTDWCPPCNEAKEHLLASPMFKRVSEGWFKVYVDGDSLTAGDWEKLVPYRYYPSFVFLSSKFEEVARYTGPLRQAAFEEWSKEVGPLVSDPIAKLKSRVLARFNGGLVQRTQDVFKGTAVDQVHREEVRLLKWALDQDDRALIETLTSHSKFPELEPELLRNQIAKTENKEQRIELYQRVLNQLIKRDGWGEVLDDFCSYDSKACAPQQVHIEERLNALRDRTGLTDSEKASMLGEEYFYLSDIYQMLGKKSEEKQMARRCVAEYERLRKGSVLKLSRAGHQGMVACLEASGDTAKAQAAIKQLIAEYPSEPTFQMRMARILRKTGKAAQALEWITKAEQVAYGYNWFNTQLIKADILLDLKRAADAKAVLDQALSQLELDERPDSRNQSTAARLRTAQAKAEAGLKTR